MVGIIGDPVRHSLSPMLHNAAFAASGLDWVYVAFPVTGGDVARALDGVRSLGIAGLSVTMPHKEAVAKGVDRVSLAAERLQSANTVVRRPDGTLYGDTTDGAGLVDYLRLDEGVDLQGAECLLLGAGAAGRAVAEALGAAGAKSVTVVARRREQAETCAALAGPAGRTGTVAMTSDAAVVINATPVGMGGDPVPITGAVSGGGLPLGLRASDLGVGQVVVDLIYAPPVTPLLEEARARGAVALNGLGMLLHQAGRQFQMWTNEPPPLEAMSTAVVAQLARNRH